MNDQLTLANSRVLVTGGAGFIGSHLVELLVDYGARLTVLDNLSSGSSANLALVSRKHTFLHADLRDVTLDNLLATHDVVFHLAANAYVPPSVQRPAWDYENNVVGTFRLLEAMRWSRWPGRLIYASSAAVYGEPTKLPIAEEDPLVPISPYGVGKLVSERYVAVYSQLYGLRTASLRFFSCYGPRQRKQVVYDLINKIAENTGEVSIFGDGTQMRDFNYVEDTAQSAVIVAERAPLQGEAYNVASGRACSIRELAETLCRILAVRPKFAFSGAVRPGDPEKWSVDISRLTALGYQPQMTLEEGLSRTVKWLSDNTDC